jgi:hypothetical protein
MKNIEFKAALTLALIALIALIALTFIFSVSCYAADS